MYKKITTSVTILLLISTIGCSNSLQQQPAAKPALTHGQVQMTLKKGQTTKQEVLETFGAPNITTIDAEKREVWTYQKHASATQSSSNSSYTNIIFWGKNNRAAGFEASSKTMTLIIKFDANDRIYDFNSRSSSF